MLHVLVIDSHNCLLIQDFYVVNLKKHVLDMVLIKGALIVKLKLFYLVMDVVTYHHLLRLQSHPLQ